MAGHKQMEAYFRNQSKPKTFAEIAKDLHDVLTFDELEDSLKLLVQNGEIVCKDIATDCRLYWRSYAVPQITKTPCKVPESGKLSNRFKTPVLKNAIRKPTSQARQPFKSPALVQKTSATPNRLSTPNSETPKLSSLRKETSATVARDILRLNSELEEIEKEISELSQCYHVNELQSHIDTLHEYNEIKDAGQVLLGKLAEVEGTTTASLYGRYDLDLDS